MLCLYQRVEISTMHVMECGMHAHNHEPDCIVMMHLGERVTGMHSCFWASNIAHVISTQVRRQG